MTEKNSTVGKFTHLSTQQILCAGLGTSGEQDRRGPVLIDLPVWCYLSSSHPGLELPVSVRIKSFASNQAAFFSLSSKNPGDRGGTKAWEVPEVRAVNTMTHL